MSTPLSIPSGSLRIEPFGPTHDRAGFTCGNTYIDAQLQRAVLPMHEKGLTRAFAALGPGSQQVLGFYAMHSHQIEAWSVPPAWEPVLAQYHLSAIPAAYISLFATREQMQGRGIGRAMMGDALRRIKLASTLAIGIHVVVLDAADQRAYDFYASLNFQGLGQGLRMFYPVAAIP